MPRPLPGRLVPRAAALASSERWDSPPLFNSVVRSALVSMRRAEHHGRPIYSGLR